LTEDQIVLSDLLKAMFPAYLNRLQLRVDKHANKNGCGCGRGHDHSNKGTLLTLDEYSEGNFNDYVKSFVIASAQERLDSGEGLFTPGTMECDFDWVTVDDGKVVDIDLAAYAACVTRMKPVPAFDAVDFTPNPGGDRGTWENILLGVVEEGYTSKHFTRFSFEIDTAIDDPYPLADAKIIKMMSPMDYIGTRESTTAKHWRIRHGAADRDTSIAIPIILATKLKNAGKKVDFKMPWGVPHSGDYDLDEVFAWMEAICDKDLQHARGNPRN
jgi:hypothetical protein